jgi:hypothetical protein
MNLKFHLNESRTRDLPACSLVPEPLRYRVHLLTGNKNIFFYFSELSKHLVVRSTYSPVAYGPRFWSTYSSFILSPTLTTALFQQVPHNGVCVCVCVCVYVCVWTFMRSIFSSQLSSLLEIVQGICFMVIYDKLRPFFVGIRSADHATPLCPLKLALSSSTSGGRSVGIILSRIKATELLVKAALHWTTFVLYIQQ